MDIALDHKRLTIEDINKPAATFLIERFDVPELLDKVILTVSTPSDEDKIACILVYDSLYDLRAEYRDIHHSKRLIIAETDIESSTGTRPGPIASGEWILVVHLQDPLSKQHWHCEYEIMGRKN
ncbi:hypothetical protein HZY91_05750 [Facklamia sp. DSM 111018]|uniref:Uncharacterized protein n=1 Tax=Facklamia lactis TaxID=2749967 RepID=A0ABS0LQG1_9LACT|nr:hypothetical protein [Facklamia lactis]MBG9986395.1 hypothetical protein [Facklamia lactis]